MKPRRQEPAALGRIVELVRDLRDRCPWDAKQTPHTLRPYLVEEVLELDHAIACGTPDHIRDELGDLLLHLAYQIVLGEEQGSFGSEDVTSTIETKMQRRHPHLFEGAARPESWELQKKKELAAERSILDGLPPLLPALLMAYRLQERAAGVGFDWTDATGPREKLAEELSELDAALQAAEPDGIAEEIGDLLFSVVNLARKLEIDPRAALERANDKFARRFRGVERAARKRDLDLHRADLAQLDELWTEVKADQG